LTKINSDIDDNIDIEIDTSSDEFCGFKKDFLLAKLADRRDTKKPPERPVPKTQAKRTETQTSYRVFNILETRTDYNQKRAQD
jgi:hypothetical protein